MRTRRAAVVAALTVLLPLAAPASAAEHFDVQRPVPSLVTPPTDYESPIEAPGGAPAIFPPLPPEVAIAAVNDRDLLIFTTGQDLGGFGTAPIGATPLASGGRSVVGEPLTPQLPTLNQIAGGQTQSFGGAPLAGATTSPPDNGLQAVQGLGVPPTVVVPTPSSSLPPDDTGGFVPVPSPSPGPTRSSPSSSPRPVASGPSATAAPAPSGSASPPRSPTPQPTSPTPTAARSSPPPTTGPTSAPPTRSPSPSPSPSPTVAPPPPPPTVTFSMTNDRNSQPLMTASNMAPGQSASGFVVIGNAGTVRFDYSLRSDGTASKLWNALQLTVVDVASGRVIVDHAPLTSTPTAIGSLAPGATQKLLVRLELPSWYGNDYQGQSARIDFVWHATG